MKINQLFISPSYVPIDSSVTLINAKIIDKLEDFDVNTIVLTMSPADTTFTVTPELSEIFESDRKVYRVRAYESGGKLLIAFRKVLRTVFPVIFFIPDFHFIWESLAIFKLFKIKRECNIDVIHSVSAPYCSHVVGYFAKQILKRPWVCHLDDFWVDNPFEHFDRYRFINRWIEKKCFKEADVVLSTSKEILSIAGARYPETLRKKFLFIPPCYEPKHYPVDHKMNREKYTFTFLGVFYPGRREPSSLFSALQILKGRHPDIYSKIAVLLVGIDYMKYGQIADEAGVSDAVKCRGRVDYMESMKLMKEASVLVHLGLMSGKFSEDIHISGKMFEYLGAERLLMSITTPNGPVAEFTKKNGGIVCDYNNHEDIAERIVQIAMTYSVDDLFNWKNPPHVEKIYSSESVADHYKQLFQSLISNA